MLRLILALVVVAIAAVQANALSSPARSGQLNTYYAYQNPQPNVAIPIPSDLATDANNPFTPGTQTIVLVHGHNGNYETDLNPQVKTEVLRNREGFVVITVDWSTYSTMTYSNAVSAVPSVGRLLAEFLIRLQTRSTPLISYANLHLVGFDLGAHVVGIAGREITRLTNGVSQVARITGLDPAGSQWGSSSARLRNTDAAYVEVLHTDGDGLLSNGIGTSIGDVDFFANGGSNQPGCLTHACSHNRAHEIFAGTFFRTGKLYGYLCNSNLQLALNKCRGHVLHVGHDDEALDKPRVDGVYRVNTGRTYPY